MFTGIVQGVAPIVAIEYNDNFRTYSIQLPDTLLSGLITGASVANNGCCLTVTHINGNVVDFDLMQETLKVTNLGLLTIGDYVNIERAATIGDEIGGHLMSGHISCCVSIKNIKRTQTNYEIEFQIAESFMPYILPKGFIGIDGISLTLGETTENSFSVHLIPETLNRTTLGKKQIGDLVNIEIDPQTQAIVDTVKRYLAK